MCRTCSHGGDQRPSDSWMQRQALGGVVWLPSPHGRRSSLLVVGGHAGDALHLLSPRVSGGHTTLVDAEALNTASFTVVPKITWEDCCQAASLSQAGSKECSLAVQHVDGPQEHLDRRSMAEMVNKHIYRNCPFEVLRSSMPQRALRPEEEVPWTPTPGRYLLATCYFGEVSNQIDCMESQLIAAGLLNRTLVVDRKTVMVHGKWNWSWDVFWDVEHSEACFGKDTVISMDEYKARHPEPDGSVTIHEVTCLRNKHDCTLLPDIAHGRPDLVWPPDGSKAIKRRKLTASQFQSTFGASEAQLLCLGDLFGFSVKDSIYNARPFGPFRRSCMLPVRPHQAIIDMAKNFVRMFLGRQYIAVHIRRGDFYRAQRFCSRGEKAWCYRSIAEIAEYLNEKVQALGVTTLYVATNAHPLEMSLLKSRLARFSHKGRGLTIVTLPEPPRFKPENGTHSLWNAESWVQAGLEGSMHAELAVEKLICTMANHFLGTPTSTFSLHILRMRQSLGLRDCNDSAVGQDAEIQQLRLISFTAPPSAWIDGLAHRPQDSQALPRVPHHILHHHVREAKLYSSHLIPIALQGSDGCGSSVEDGHLVLVYHLPAAARVRVVGDLR
eukprot:SM000277S10348  [mRNA]  locus=s277:114222:122725:- [translate_table: standard]